jgi:Ca2+-binding RTX toxin-like protein
MSRRQERHLGDLAARKANMASIDRLHLHLRGLLPRVGRGVVALAVVGAASAALNGLPGEVPRAGGVAAQCFGADATIVGTPGVDILRGTAGDDVIVGGGSDGGTDGEKGDKIWGLGGNDKICAVADATETIARGGSGKDQIESAGAVFGGPGDDSLVNAAGDPLFAFQVGGPGDDLMTSSNDDGTWFVPGPGNDTVTATKPSAFSLVDFFHGVDRGVTVDLRRGRANGQGDDALAGIRMVLGSRFADIIVGDDRTNAFDGLGGADVLKGFAGRDYLRGGAGDDWVDGGRGGDQLAGSAGSDALHGRRGADFLVEVRPEPNLVLAGPGRDTCGGGYRVPPTVERGCERHGRPPSRTVATRMHSWTSVLRIPMS